MQGQVTKVSKSKPQEILGLIEEAAGTRMYDQKKAEALKTIAKKDDKLKEIRTTIDTDITPTINKLQQDEQNYKMYTELKKRYKLLNDQLIAYEYWQLMTSVRQTEIDVQNMEVQTNEYQQRNVVITKEIQEIHNEVKIIENERNESKFISKKLSFCHCSTSDRINLFYYGSSKLKILEFDSEYPNVEPDSFY